ncbi:MULTISPECIES: pseudouridine synthase [Prevotellaceae]|jgi:23S rRNA pseudouridine2605 synthase|uniref:Pseudouridine synthase n=1 Tax=Xylanibacter rarus TaxID=1676614 RepID=A0A8E1QVP7_9BACT|nr:MULTISPECIES: pseudouridine synthase [Prevotellaceae]KOO66957.1 pseudouridine synthase [Xylanibacter rarus]MBS5875178.1 rRNA pseudouridine synthase [Prevotella sp.]HJH75520.1 rRNA pseudouridine synthase [Prevotellaceae bacterium]
MTEDLENKKEGMYAGQNEVSREGYKPAENTNYRNGERPMRPRIKVQRAYSSSRNYNNDSAGFRPEGFGAALQSDGGQQRSYRPRYNSGQQGGYQQRQGYQPQQRGGYRPRYNSDADGNYQPRQNQYGQRQGSPYRQNYNQGMDGGYQPRQSAGYRPRYNNGGGEGGYQPRQNSYQRGGYQRGGYGPQRQPAYQQRGGYRQRTPDYDPNAKYSQKKRIEYKEANIDPTVPVRLNKYLANAGICSRREADEFIQAGVVSVNGQVVTELGTKVLRTDDIRFHDQKVSMEKKVYVLLNKPKDCVTTSDDPQQRKTVMDLVKNACPERIYPVGRLDRNTTGVLLLTNDGDLASKLTHPKFLKKKIYHVFLDKKVTAHDMQQIATGITLEDGEVHADAIEYASATDKSQVGIEIHSGKNRIVRRIFESLGYRVVKLDRVLFAGLTKKNLRRGDWRFLTEKEVDMLRMGAFE